MKLLARRLHSIRHRVAPSHAVQHNRARRQETPRGKQRDVPNLLDAQTTADALIDQRAVDKPIADDPGSTSERRGDYLLHDLGPRSCEQQCLRTVAQLDLWIEQQGANTFAELGAARLATLHNLESCPTQTVGQERHLRRLADPVGPFEAHEHVTRLLRRPDWGVSWQEGLAL